MQTYIQTHYRVIKITYYNKTRSTCPICYMISQLTGFVSFLSGTGTSSCTGRSLAAIPYAGKCASQNPYNTEGK